VRHTVIERATLAETLRVLLPDSSGRRLKQLLEAGRIRVNGAVRKHAKAMLAPGDVVEIAAGAPRTSVCRGLTIVHEDDDVIVVVKGSGLLTIATERERERTAVACLFRYVRRRHPRARVFVVHRLDKLASGLLVFARTPHAKQALQAQFEAHTALRVYVAVVEGKLPAREGVLRSRLVETPGGLVRETRSPSRGRLAVTRWRVLREGSRFSTLEIRLETGRRNQIRVHLAGFGHPIVGDAAYGSRIDPIGRLVLHARTLGFDHPRTDERLRFESPVPRAFRDLER
jgi:23S rRNA pseudouridine1911/1915/1917 synthase